MVNESTIRMIISVKLRDGLAPHASPMMSEPRLGKRNSALEMIANCLMVFDFVKRTLKIRFGFSDKCFLNAREKVGL